ncbi:PKD domain-containing protein [Pedobacter polaris]|uniref:PKD domain-containing protein n=1 Tax=Pedobacter polaris TaxID=2571273 RepID=A0A4U1CE84_9SPHI|nr:PKD domain-containing protein [Pedobacter polaris]TKC05362.1 PKD domain-containing protein [Pedobacter polaris]
MNTKLFATLLGVLALLSASCKKEKPVKGEDKPVIQSPYIKKVYEFKPAPGQFVNEGGDSDLAKTDILLGDVGKGVVSLGGYGGYIVFGFDHAIINATGLDLGIYSNPLIGVDMEFSEPGIVCVMQDVNKNGSPDDVWYELAGSDYSASTTLKNYKITYYKPASLAHDIRWIDNQGKEGLILRNMFHAQDYFPSWASGTEISYTGTLVRNTLTLGDIITNKPLRTGYSDNGSSEYVSFQEQFGRGYNTFDIDWAVNDNGDKVSLTSIDFVKVYTAQNCNGNLFSPDLNNERSRYVGEISTEIAGAVDLKLIKK